MIDNLPHNAKTEIYRTNPDFIAYVPQGYDGTQVTELNEHFLVFDGPDGSLMAVWTHSQYAQRRQHNAILFARSEDGGRSWTSPHLVAGSAERMASWGFPLVSSRGRIYVIYNRNMGNRGWIKMHTGIMEGVYSDDSGRTWSEPQQIPMPKHSWDDPRGEVPSEWIVWQAPMKDLAGGYFVGYSRWAHPDRSRYSADKDGKIDWTWIDSVCEFMRFTNIDKHPEPRDIQIEYSAWDEKSLKVPHYLRPDISVAQEPSIVRLLDQRLFCVMRTCTGCIWWSQSRDDGRTWSAARPLLDRDHGYPLENSVASDPLYPLSDGRYALFYHNHRGQTSGGKAPESRPRNPVYLAIGEYREHAEQPLWFSKPKLLMTSDRTTVTGEKAPSDLSAEHNSSLSMYTSFSHRDGEDVLWYPERKFFLLGKKITGEMTAEMTLPF